jgi:hypothetical protein
MTPHLECALCGGPAVHRHHWTGRLAPRACYFDPTFVVALCASDHATLHTALRTLGLEFPGTVHPTALVTHRVERVALHLGLLADANRSLVLDTRDIRGLQTVLLDAVSSVGRPAGGAR